MYSNMNRFAIVWTSLTSSSHHERDFSLFARLRYYYRQHCAQRKALVLLRGRFWSFSPHRGDTLQWWGWNLAWRRGPRGVSLVWFSQNLQNLYHVSSCVKVLKFRWIFLRGCGVMRVVWVWLSSNIQRPSAAKLCVRPQKVLEVQERARDPLSPCQVWWGSDITCRRGGQKRWVVLSLCLSVDLFVTLLKVGDCAPYFAMKALDYRNDFDAVG